MLRPLSKIARGQFPRYLLVMKHTALTADPTPAAFVAIEMKGNGSEAMLRSFMLIWQCIFLVF